MVSRDRGQLILVGAIAIALILLGLVLIVNTALFTQVVGSEGTVQSAKEGGLSGQEIADSLSEAVAAANRGATPSMGHDDIDDDVNATVDDLEPVFVNRTFGESGSFVSMEYLGHNREGTSISQTSADNFTAANGADDWTVITDVNRTDVGGFVMVINTSRSSFSNDFRVDIEGVSDDVRLTVSPNGSNVDVTVDNPVDVDCYDIRPTNGTIRIDVSSGRVYENGSCRFDIFERLKPGYSIDFQNGESVVGTYRLTAASNSILGNLDPRFDTAADDPTRTTAVWSFEYRYLYDSKSVTIESDDREVEVYD